MSLKIIITEGRVEDAFKKYFPGTSPDSQLYKVYHDEIVPGSAGINANHKYLDWVTKNWSPTGTDEGVITHNLKEILVAVSKFDNQAKRLDIKDLNQYRDIDQLFDALKKVGETARRTVEITDDVDKIYEDNRFVVVVPKTHSASCYYGAGTKWCVASKDTKTHFSSYKSNGELYYIIDKTLPTSSKYYKVALNKKIEGLREDFWDVKDKLISDKTDILHILQNKKMLEKIRDNFITRFEERIEQEKELLAKRLSAQEERRERERIRRQQLIADAEHRRATDAWNPEDTDTEGTLANALKEWLLDSGEWDGATKADIRGEIEELRSQMESDPEVIEDPNGEKAQEYGEDLNNLEEDLENAESVYDIFPSDYDYYGLTQFEYHGAEYVIGDDEEADYAAEESIRSLITDIGYEGFNSTFIENHIDGEQVAMYFEDWFREDVYDSPESYLDEDEDRELSETAETNIEKRNDQISDLRHDIEETDDESDIEMLEGEIEELEGEIEDIKSDDDNYDWNEEAIESAVESRMRDVEYDPMSFLRDYGMEDRVQDFIDEDEFIKDIVSSDGRGHNISRYDGIENEIMFDNEWYYIYRVN